MTCALDTETRKLGSLERGWDLMNRLNLFRKKNEGLQLILGLVVVESIED